MTYSRTLGSTASTWRGVKPRDTNSAELGVHRRVLHDHRRVVGETDEFEFAVVDREALCRRVGLVVTRRREDVGVPRHHVVVVVGFVRGDDVVHRVVVAQCPVHLPRAGPGVGGGELKTDR